MISEKIALLNQTILDCLNESSETKIVSAFTELGIKLLEADFGFVWFKSNLSKPFKLVHKSRNLPYIPQSPRTGGRNYKVLKILSPDFVSSVKKREDKYDVSKYMKSFVIIPISYKQKVYGNIVLCFKQKKAFSLQDKSFASFIGNSAAQAITIRRSIENERQARLEAEKNQEELAKMNRISKAISDCNHALVHSTTEEEFLRKACQVVVTNSGHKMVWIGYAENNKEKSVRPVSYSGFEEGYLESINISWADNTIGRGPTGTAIRTRKISICRNVKNDPYFKPWRKKALKRSYASSISLPLIWGEKTFGALNIYSDQEGSFTEGEVELLNKLARELAYGIMILRLKVSKEILDEQKKLLYEEKRKTEFIADATHEFRTPLAIIRGNIDLAVLKDLKNPNALKKVFKEINHEVEHLSELISDLSLLTYDKSRSGKISAYQTTDLTKIIKHVTNTLEGLARSRKISIKTHKMPPVSIRGDQIYLEKMFTNLVKNAVTYSPKGGFIEISGSKKKSVVEISIKDTGIGIAEADLPNIFKRFFKAESSKAARKGGVGLGLAIAKKIAEDHGGDITVKSSLGKGSTFIVSLPLPNNKKPARA